MSLDLTDDKSTMAPVAAFSVRQQAITWANVDLDLLVAMHVTLPGHCY